MVTILRSGTRSLRLAGDQNGWCRATLEIDGAAVALGALAEATLMGRLAAALREDPEDETVGTIDGVPVRWALSLSEEHATLYVGRVSGTTRLFVQDANAKLIATIDLSPFQRAEWERALRSRSDLVG